MIKKIKYLINYIHLKYQKIPIYFIGFLIFLMALQQFPIIRETYYDQIRLILYLSFAVLVTYSILNIKKLFFYKFYKIFLWMVLYSLLLSVIMTLINGDLLPVLLYVVPFGIITISISNNYSNKAILTLLWLYAISNSIMGLANIFYYGNGFDVTRLVPEKNQIGPMVGYSVLVFLFFMIKYKSIYIKFFSFGLVILAYMTLLAISNRSAVVGVTLLIVFIMIYFIFIGIRKLLKKKIKEVSITSGVIIFIILLGFQFELIQSLFDTFLTSVTYNRLVTDLNALSSGRIQLIEDSLIWIKTYPFFGFIGLSSIPISEYTHVYIIHTWMQYGLIGSLPFVLFYFFLIIFNLILMFKLGKDTFTILLFMILSVGFVISLLEYSYPYGPGVSQFILWFMLGQFLIRDKKYDAK